MNSKFFIAAIGGGILSFLLGWLIYGMLLMGFMESHMTHYEGLMKEMPNIYLIFLANILMGFFLTIVFSQWAGIKTLAKGMTVGLFIAFSMALIYDLYFMAQMNLYSFSAMVVDIIASSVIGGIVGGLIGWILGFERKTAKA